MQEAKLGGHDHCFQSPWKILGKPSIERTPKDQAHLKLPKVLNLKLVLGGVEVTVLHLSLRIQISGIRDKTCHLLLTVFN